MIMEMERINEKLNSFSEIVLKDASRKAGEILKDAQNEKEKRLEEQEIDYLKEAYRKIHEALAEVEKENNSLYSAKLFEAKKILYNKRMEITDRVFENVLKRLEEYRKTKEYSDKLRQLIENGLNEVGGGKVRITVDNEDLNLAKKLAGEARKDVEVAGSDTKLFGGCIVINETSGILADYSFKSRMEQQRKAFLEFSGLNVEL